MANGTANVTGDLKSVISGNNEAGSIEVILCGYGSQVPRQNNLSLVARPTSTASEVPVDAAGTFSFSVMGNDYIQPAGTYYTITVRDANGDVVQCAAYLFLGDNDYDLNTINPFDPTQPPSPLPPLIIPQLLVIGYNPTVDFPGDQYTAFQITLQGDVTSSTLTNMVPGNLYTFIIIQDGAGGHRFTWPANVHNGAAADPEASSTTTQTFVADENLDLWAIGPGMWA